MGQCNQFCYSMVSWGLVPSSMLWLICAIKGVDWRWQYGSVVHWWGSCIWCNFFFNWRSKIWGFYLWLLLVTIYFTFKLLEGNRECIADIHYWLVVVPRVISTAPFSSPWVFSAWFVTSDKSQARCSGIFLVFLTWLLY